MRWWGETRERQIQSDKKKIQRQNQAGLGRETSGDLVVLERRQKVRPLYRAVSNRTAGTTGPL